MNLSLSFSQSSDRCILVYHAQRDTIQRQKTPTAQTDNNETQPNRQTHEKRFQGKQNTQQMKEEDVTNPMRWKFNSDI